MLVIEDGHDLAPLAAEAAAQQASAHDILEAEPGPNEAMAAYRGRRRHRLAFGPRLAQFHEAVVQARCDALFGRRLLPTRASYMYLGAADYIDFHQDVPTCRVTAAACLAGAPPALLILPPPGLAPAELAALLAATPAAELAARCDRLLLPPGRLVLFEGHLLAHALAAHHGAVTLAAMCFAAVDAD